MKSKKLKLLTTLLLLLPLCVVLLGAGCDDELDTIKNTHGLVKYFGDPSVDGCGWMIEIDTVIFSPINLDVDYQKHSLKIVLDYKILTSTWNCGWRTPGYQQIEISRIITKN